MKSLSSVSKKCREKHHRSKSFVTLVRHRVGSNQLTLQLLIDAYQQSACIVNISNRRSTESLSLQPRDLPNVLVWLERGPARSQ